MRDSLSETMRAWAEAEGSGDTTALATLLTDDFAGIGPRGFQLDKSGWIERFRNGSYRNQSFDWAEVEAREYGDAAIARGTQTSRGEYQGQPVGGRFRAMQVYLRRDGSWKLAAMQLSEMAEAPAGSGRP